jgi:hypothetical protein
MLNRGFCPDRQGLAMEPGQPGSAYRAGVYILDDWR